VALWSTNPQPERSKVDDSYISEMQTKPKTGLVNLIKGDMNRSI